MSDTLFAILVTTLTGLTMGLGAMIIFFVKKENNNFITYTMGLSAGAMLMISFFGVLPSVLESFTEICGDEHLAMTRTLVLFVIGLLMMIGVDRLLPKHAHHHPNSVPSVPEDETDKNKGLYRAGMGIAVAIAIHNIPEGIATFTTLMTNRSLGVMVAIAIVLHNLPIGVAIAMPIYLAKNNKLKAVGVACLTGLVSPIAAMMAYLFMMPFFSPMVISSLLAIVAGVMVYICIDELMPASRAHGNFHLATFGIISGIMLISLVFIILG